MLLEQVRSTQEERDRVRTQIEAAERDYDLNKAAELRYGQLPKLEERLRDLSSQLDTAKYVRLEVGENEVAEVVSRATHIPLSRLMEGERDKLLRLETELHQRVIGQDTVSAMQSGVFWGYIGLIEGLIARIRAEYGHDLTVIATGGLAPIFARTSEVIQHSDPDLTLRGLALLYQRNAP